MLALCTLGCGESSGAPPSRRFVLREGQDRARLAATCAVLEEPAAPRAATLPEIRAHPERFRPVDPTRTNRGFDPRAHWLWCPVDNPASEAARRILDMTLTPDTLDVYQVTAEGAVTVLRSGARLDFDRRPLEEPRIAVPLAFPPGETQLIMRVQTTNTLHLDPVLWSARAYDRRSRLTLLAEGAYYGLLLAMIVYNAIIFASTRDTTYLAYVAFQAAILASQACTDRYAEQYLWPHHLWWGLRSEPLFGTLAVVAGAVFVRSFLRLALVAPRLDRALAWLRIAGVVAAAAMLVSPGAVVRLAASLFTLGCAITVLVAAGWAVWHRLPNALTFVAAWLLLIVCTSAAMLSATGFVQTTAMFPLLKVGSALEAMLLSLSLAARISTLRRERERVQLRLLEAERVHASSLEGEVAARTETLLHTVERLREAQDTLVRQERLAVLGRMVAGVAHEIGNPLNFARGGSTEVIRRLRALDELVAAPAAAGAASLLDEVRAGVVAAERAAVLVAAGTDRMSSILDGLRGCVREGTGAPEPTDLVAALSSVVELMNARLAESRINVVRRFGAIPPVVCRADEIQQVFLNVIVNACLAMPAGGDLTVEAACHGEGVEVAVADTGPGVPTALAERIFEPFFTTRPPQEGTGLGLYLSQQIVHRHGGELRLEHPAVGARFVIVLPVAGHPAATGAHDSFA